MRHRLRDAEWTERRHLQQRLLSRADQWLQRVRPRFELWTLTVLRSLDAIEQRGEVTENRLAGKT